MGRCQEDRARQLLVMLSVRTRVHQHELKYRKFHLTIRAEHTLSRGVKLGYL